MEAAAGREGTHHRSWAPATRRAHPSGHRQRRSWPPHCTSSPCRRSRSRHRSDSSAGRAAGPPRGGRLRTWRTSEERKPPPRTWLWWERKEERQETASWVWPGRCHSLGAVTPGTNVGSYSETPFLDSPSVAHAAKTTSPGCGNHCDLSSTANVLS